MPYFSGFRNQTIKICWRILLLFVELPKIAFADIRWMTLLNSMGYSAILKWFPEFAEHMKWDDRLDIMEVVVNRTKCRFTKSILFTISSTPLASSPRCALSLCAASHYSNKTVRWVFKFSCNLNFVRSFSSECVLLSFFGIFFIQFFRACVCVCRFPYKIKWHSARQSLSCNWIGTQHPTASFCLLSDLLLLSFDENRKRFGREIWNDLCIMNSTNKFFPDRTKPTNFMTIHSSIQHHFAVCVRGARKTNEEMRTISFA